ncbi:LPS translocon maturation chaperone LptM [Marinivivus vitaminiproducens]|uniref:LPS translocon maturation chaperone LptM n=1 Tax=Marinivivus vitaminiproducens TaxID=3035935 RepID=UPI002799B3FC|nr:lipoprotein [Geminicoccaceae bacterium SCSIO 64248]
MSRVARVLVLGITVLLAGCGIKGPLELPEDPQAGAPRPDLDRPETANPSGPGRVPGIGGGR